MNSTLLIIIFELRVKKIQSKTSKIVKLNEQLIYQMIFQMCNIKPKALKNLFGALLLKFGTSVTTCWGNINLYFFSEFHNQGYRITSTTNSIILCFSVIPMILCLIFATKLCSRFGYVFVIRLCCAMFFLAPLINLLVFSPYSFVICSVVIPGSAFALSSIPILNCMWKQFPSSKNKVTALLVIAFGIGGIIWNFLFMHMINPTNLPPLHKDNNINFFTSDVTKNVRKTAIIGFLITGLLAIIGSLLLERTAEPQQTITQEIQINDKKNPKNQSTETKSQTQPTLTFQQAVTDQRFILIMVVSFLTGLYEIHLIMNFKIIYLPFLADDHFLSYCIMLCSVVSILGAFFWGWLGDRKGVAFTILLLSILDFGSKLFSDFALTKPTIVTMVILVGLISKSMTTLAGPGFVEFFGLKMGTELLPYKGVSILLGYAMVPFFQLLSSNHLSPHQYLVVISFASVITLGCAVRLYSIVAQSKKDSKSQYSTTPEIQIFSPQIVSDKIELVKS